VIDTPRIEELRRRLQRDPASIAFAQLAEEYRRIGEHLEAVRVCQAGLDQHPAYLSARVTLGRALLELGRLEEAETEFTRVIESAPDNVVARRALEDIGSRRSRLEPPAATPATSARGNLPAPRDPMLAELEAGVEVIAERRRVRCD
jgi:tetratricopeptide (TPR) repeat protein